jgi:hypothetical protein
MRRGHAKELSRLSKVSRLKIEKAPAANDAEKLRIVLDEMVYGAGVEARLFIQATEPLVKAGRIEAVRTWSKPGEEDHLGSATHEARRRTAAKATRSTRCVRRALPGSGWMGIVLTHGQQAKYQEWERQAAGTGCAADHDRSVHELLVGGGSAV